MTHIYNFNERETLTSTRYQVEGTNQKQPTRCRKITRAGHTRQYCRENVTMFSGHKVVCYCIITIFGVATPSRPKKNFRGSITLSRSYKIIACPALKITKKKWKTVRYRKVQESSRIVTEKLYFSLYIELS